MNDRTWPSNIRPFAGESLDGFVRRSEGIGIAASLRRFAWLMDISTDEAVEVFEQAVADHRAREGAPAVSGEAGTAT